jgi:hypothetical protein
MKLDTVLQEASSLSGTLLQMAAGFAVGMLAFNTKNKLAIAIPSNKKFEEIIKLPPYQRKVLTFTAEDKKTIAETQYLVDQLVKKASYKISKTGTGILHKSWELYL